MSMTADRCACGRMPGLRSRPLSAESVETWVECPGCGHAGAASIDEARDDAGAIGNWNNGKGRKW